MFMKDRSSFQMAPLQSCRTTQQIRLIRLRTLRSLMWVWGSDLSEPDEGVGQRAPDHGEKTSVGSHQHLVDGLHLEPAAADGGRVDVLQVPDLRRGTSKNKPDSSLSGVFL